MIDQEIPVLRKEELINILEALFRFSQEPNNAFIRKQDGLFVLDFHQAFLDHVSDSDVHATSEETAILHDFSIVNDVLHYKGQPIIINASQEEGNAVEVKPDGLFVKDLSESVHNHLNDSNHHLTNEERQTLSSIESDLSNAIDDTKEELRREIYKFEILNSLPVDESLIDEVTIYCIPEEISESGEIHFVKYVYREHQWIKFDLTNETYQLFAIKDEIAENYVAKEDYHNHDNKSVLDKFTEDEHTNRLLYDGTDILDNMQISDDPDNAIFVGSDGKLFVPDLSSQLDSIATQASLSKTVLLNEECDQNINYELLEDITNFNFLLIHYYIKQDPDPNTGIIERRNAKMEMVDTDGLVDLYNRNVLYTLTDGYGLSTYETKIRFSGNNIMHVAYYNHICVYKIVGVR